MSSVPSIDGILFKKLPTRGGAFERVVRSGGRLYAVRKLGDRTVFTNSFVSKNFCYVGGDGEQYAGVLRVLVALGLAKRSDVEKHVANVKEMRRRRDQIEMVDDVKKMLVKLEIEIPASLREALEQKRAKG